MEKNAYRCYCGNANMKGVEIPSHVRGFIGWIMAYAIANGVCFNCAEKAIRANG